MSPPSELGAGGAAGALSAADSAAVATVEPLSTDSTPRQAWREGPIGQRNVVWGWVTIVLGAVSGAIIMAWSFSGPFPPPPGFENYASLSRRMVRLAHVAFFMLPIINIIIGKEIDYVALSDKWKKIASWLAIVAMIGIPVGLILGALVHINLKYLSSPAATALLISLALVAIGKVRATR